MGFFFKKQPEVKVFDTLPEQTARNVLGLANGVGRQLTFMTAAFAPDGTVGSAIAPVAKGVVGANIKLYEPVLMRSSDHSLLVEAFFNNEFQGALYDFQLLFGTVSLPKQAELVDRFIKIDFAKFARRGDGEAETWFQGVLAAIPRELQTQKMKGLKLKNVVPLLKVPHVMETLKLARGYATVMNMAMKSYEAERASIGMVNKDNEKIVKEMDQILTVFLESENARLLEFSNIKTAQDELTQKMHLVELMAGMTSRGDQVNFLTEAAKKLATAVYRHSVETLASQEALVQQYSRASQIMLSNAVQSAHLESAIAALYLYLRSMQSFVLILTCLQVYLLKASAALKTHLADAISERAQEDLKTIYDREVMPVKEALGQYVNIFAQKASQLG